MIRTSPFHRPHGLKRDACPEDVQAALARFERWQCVYPCGVCIPAHKEHAHLGLCWIIHAGGTHEGAALQTVREHFPEAWCDWPYYRDIGLRPATAEEVELLREQHPDSIVEEA
jgi:hypothetical protein